MPVTATRVGDALSSPQPIAEAGAVTGGARIWLRLEGVAVLATSAMLYDAYGAGWTLFLILFLLPDASFAGYLAGPRAGAAAYNALHSYVGPLLLAGVALWSVSTALFPYALIWAAHVGFDRALGFGLKYGSGFGDTHLGRVGRGAA